jgi:iron complex outermembrane receptor protein
MGGPSDSITETQRDDSGYAAFGQLDYELTKQLTLTAGIRLEREKRKAFVNLDQSSLDPSTKLQGDKSFTEILPKVALSYKTDNSSLIYSSISKGYRAGGFDTLYPNPDNPTYDSESSINYEIGYKTKLLDNSLEFSGAVFLIDIKDQQVQQLFPTTGNIVTDNAGESSSKGFEFESRYIPADDWLLSLSGSYTDAEYQEYVGLNFLTFQEENYSGNRLPMTPKWTGNFSVQNRQTLGSNNTFGLLEWFTQIDYQYVDSYMFDAPNELEQNAYHLINFKTGIEADSWQTYLWVKNLADEYYSKVEFNFGFGRTAEAAEPRSIGITVNYNF